MHDETGPDPPKSQLLANGSFTFWETKGEPERFRAFVDDMSRYQYQFMTSHSALSHLSTQSGLLGISQIDNIQFIGKLSNLDDHLSILQKECPKSAQLSQMNDLLHNIASDMFGIAKHDSLPSEYRTIMSLPAIDESNPSDRGIPTLLPAFKAMNYDTWHKIVDYYWQDFVCFNYQVDYSLVQKLVNKKHPPTE